ncbi:hypothetical protein MNBD_PLANCTO02-322 [hydrothermal vent metagenome]|uniref:Peptidase M50 domain-containing protein n=1 Tax=hydrothermal vent metagenome TaxID=652676 RepID=A0A3B1E0Q4_9ZZZZ
MNYRDSLMKWSFSAGVWFATDVYVTYLFPLLTLLFCWRWGITLGMVFGAILFISTLLHEFGHILGARSTGGDGYEIFIWPLGGLASVYPGYSIFSKLFTAASGPLVNLALCVMAFPAVYHSAHYLDTIHPFMFPNVEFASGQISSDLLVLIFKANYILFLVNIMPIYPLDGGRIVQTFLVDRLGRDIGISLTLRTGLYMGIGMMVTGLLLPEQTPGQTVGMVVLIGAILTIFNMQETTQFESDELYDDAFLDYDISTSYASMTSTQTSVKKKPGFFKRWKEKRELKKEKLEQEQIAFEDDQVEILLDKVHKQGLDSLTVAEQHLLDRASSRLRKQRR